MTREEWIEQILNSHGTADALLRRLPDHALKVLARLDPGELSERLHTVIASHPASRELVGLAIRADIASRVALEMVGRREMATTEFADCMTTLERASKAIRRACSRVFARLHERKPVS